MHFTSLQCPAQRTRCTGYGAKTKLRSNVNNLFRIADHSKGKPKPSLHVLLRTISRSSRLVMTKLCAIQCTDSCRGIVALCCDHNAGLPRSRGIIELRLYGSFIWIRWNMAGLGCQIVCYWAICVYACPDMIWTVIILSIFICKHLILYMFMFQIKLIFGEPSETS